MMDSQVNPQEEGKNVGMEQNPESAEVENQATQEQAPSSEEQAPASEEQVPASAPEATPAAPAPAAEEKATEESEQKPEEPGNGPEQEPDEPEQKPNDPEQEPEEPEKEPEQKPEEPGKNPEQELEVPVQKPDEPVQEPEQHASDGEDATADAPAKKVYTSKKEILERIREIAHGDETPRKDEVEHLKTSFYKLHLAERDADMKAYIDAGGDPEKYQVLPDGDEEEFKAEMQVVKEKRAKAFLQQQEEREENLKKRLEIIEKVKAMATSPDEANKSFNEFKALQQQWKEIGPVPPEKSTETWHNYQLYVEQFYDLLNLNREAREYDFKKNLEAKTKLCEEAERLADDKDVIDAFHKLQDLHQQFREIGPVAKDLREQVWARFKAASTVINKRHQQHFEELRARENENLAKKTELCERVEAIAKEENKGMADWEKHSKEIIAIQAEWKKIGFAPQKMNVKIFERFRAACDDFFGRKSEFFKNLKKQFAENAEKKKALVEQAQALADSTDWKSTGDKLVALQKEWKTIGTVPRKLGDELWKNFITACNKFFDARNAAHAGTRSEERANLAKKKEIIGQLKQLVEDTADDVQDKVQQLVDDFQAVGHVPYLEKDKVYKEFHDVLDALYKNRHVALTRRRLDNFRSNLKNVASRGEEALDSERGRLMHRYEQLKQEITTYENNLGFLSVSSKKGSSLIDEMNRRVEKLKDDAKLVREKIKAIDAQNKQE